MARQAYLATIAARARGAAAALVPPSVPMRGWDGAWPAELPPAAVVASPLWPGTADRPPPLDPTAARAGRSEAAVAELRDPAAPAPAVRVELAAPPRTRLWSPPEPAIAAEVRAAREAPTEIAHDAASDSSSPPSVEAPANPLRADRPAASRLDGALISAAVASGGRPEPLRAATPVARGAAPEADRAGSRIAAEPPGARLSPAAALHAAFQWVSAPVPERSSPAAPESVRAAPIVRAELPTAHPAPPSAGERPVARAAARLAAARRDVPEPRPAPRTLHIGSIEVEIQTPRDGADRDARPVQAAPSAPVGPLARGFTTPLGLRQG